MDGSHVLGFKCGNKDCNNEFYGHMVTHVGGINDYGWWVIKCDSCQTVFSTYVGKDVNDSYLSRGGVILERLDKDVDTEADVAEAVIKHSNQ